MKIEYDCPRCDEPISVGPSDKLLLCPQCKAMLILDRDAEFVDGHWRNRDRLIEQEFKSTDYTIDPQFL